MIFEKLKNKNYLDHYIGYLEYSTLDVFYILKQLKEYHILDIHKI